MSAVILKGDKVLKISNFKYLSPDSKILELCAKDRLEEKYTYWNNIINPVEVEPLPYHWRKGSSTYHSINPALPKRMKDWEPYDTERTSH